MMIPEESLEELNSHLKNPVTMRNFRPSIVIKGTPEPFAEDVWTYVRIGTDGGPIFKTAKPCTRWVIHSGGVHRNMFNPSPIIW